MTRITDIAPADATKIINLLSVEYANAREQITSADSWRALEDYFFGKLAEQHVEMTRFIVALAEAREPAAHRAIWRYIRWMSDLDRFNDMLLQVRAYVGRTGGQPVPYPRGGHIVKALKRNIWLCACMENAAAGTGLPVTRGRATERPSIAFFMSKALKRHRVKLSEPELNRIHANRGKIAQMLEDAKPYGKISSSIK